MSGHSYTLQARYLFPVDTGPLANGSVTIADGRIVGVGGPSRTAIDLGNVAILPGLVNAHTHLEFSALSQPLGRRGNSLPQWIGDLLPYRESRGAAQRESIVSGLQQSLRHGVTTIGDICTSRLPSDYELAVAPRVTAFHEVIALSVDRMNSSMEEVVRRLDAFDEVRNGISPHAPYTVRPELVTCLADLSRTTRTPLAMHLAESPEELELLATGTGPFRDLLTERGVWEPGAFPGNVRPLDVLQRLARADRCLVIHGNFLDDKELSFIGGQARMSVVYCPRTHAYFDHPAYPLAKMLQAKVNIALGTDSRASNPDLDLFAEMKAVAKSGVVAPEQVLQLGTQNGARALGLDNIVGTLAPHKLADLAVVRLPESNATPYDLLFDEHSVVTETYLGGDPSMPLTFV